MKILIQETNPSCLCLQETRHNNKTMRPPSGYRIIASPFKQPVDQNSNSPNPVNNRGVALLISKKVNHKSLNIDTPNSIEAVAARVYDGRYYTVCSIYISPNVPVTKQELHDLLVQLPRPLLLLGDMNAKHYSWGEEENNSRGRIFEQLMNETDLCLLNDTEKTHYSSQNNSYSLIDLSFSSADIFPDFTCSVLPLLHGSDHFPIVIEKFSIPEVGEPLSRFKTEKADWDKYRKITGTYHPTASISIDGAVEEITTFIIDAATASIPVSRNEQNKKTPVPWWTPDCKSVYEQRNRAEGRLNRLYNERNLLEFRRLNALSRRTFKQAKRDCWREYVSTINMNTSPKEIWTKINKIKGKYSTHPPPLLESTNGDLTDNPEETSNIFAQAFSSVSKESQYEERFRKFKNSQEKRCIEFNPDDDLNIAYNQNFTMDEFFTALQGVGETAPGLDKITYSMIKNANPVFQRALINLFNRIFKENSFPDSWRTAVIIPIPKPNKDHSSPLNFRPISLTSCLCKLFEKMVNTRLVWFLEKNNCISETQSGFRKNRSTIDCLTQFSMDTQEAIMRGKHTIAVFFYLKKAYDTTWKHGILQKLHGYGLRGHLPIFIKNFLMNRKIQVRVGSQLSNPATIDEGVPQGSVLSCTLFAVAIDDAVENLPPSVKSTLYVDDLTIYSSARNESVAKRQMQLAINTLQTWCCKTGFSFSAEKTVSMHICRSRKGAKCCLKKSPELILNGTEISNKDNHLCLGLMIDKALTWNAHIDYIKKDCRRRLNVMKHVSHETWGADCKTLLRI